MFGFFKKKQEQAPSCDDTAMRLEFSRRLQGVTNKIHAAENIDELMLDLSPDICDLFNCDRLTLYAISKDKQSIFSKVKTGLTNISQDIVLSIGPSSIAGYVAMAERTVRITDVYDQKELLTYSTELQFNQEVDRITGYRTKQMLASPIFNPTTQTVIGAVQLLNNRDDGAFSTVAEEGLLEMCKTIGVAFVQRMKAAARMRSKYEPLLTDSIISQAELDLASNWARRKNVDIEDALVEEFQVPLDAIGKALAKSSGMQYEPFKAERRKPADALSKIDRRFVERAQSIPIEEDGRNVVIMTVEPELVTQTRTVREVYAYNNVFYRVTTKPEFRRTVDQLLGAN